MKQNIAGSGACHSLAFFFFPLAFQSFTFTLSTETPNPPTHVQDTVSFADGRGSPTAQDLAARVRASIPAWATCRVSPFVTRLKNESLSFPAATQITWPMVAAVTTAPTVAYCDGTVVV